MSSTQSLKNQVENRKYQFRALVAENKTYPLATITYHGPDPEQATKIIVAVLASESAEPEIKEWTGNEIAENVEAAREIAAFVKENKIERVITSEWVLSCPHEEGVDYPLGEPCPHCPGWDFS